MTRILLVDDHPVFRRGLSVMLAASGYEIVGEASSGTEAVARATTLLPDIVLMDVGLPELGGIAATAQITGAHTMVRVVVITMYDDAETVKNALDAGAIGYVVKDAPPDEILAAVRAAELGASLVGSGVSRPTSAPPPASARLPELTRREREVAGLLERGLSNRVIGERLGVSGKTVANYVANLRLKLGAGDRYEVAEIVRERG